MNDTSNPVSTNDEEQARYVQEALAFMGIAEWISLEVTVATLPNDKNVEIASWKLVTDKLNVAGSYYLRNAASAHTGVVMSIGLMQHRYARVIYEAIQAADGFAHPTDPDRNSLLELALRQAYAQAADKVPIGQVGNHVQREYHFHDNLEAIGAAYDLRKANQGVKKTLKKNGKMQ